MLLKLSSQDVPLTALRQPSLPLGRRPPARFAPAPASDKPMRAALAAAAIFGVAAFILGAGNRLTQGPWFLYAPEVSLVPPVGRAAWQHAFVLHQQSPLYALCGGYEVGGMESLTIYQFLYWWEWWRIASIVLLAGALFVASLLFLRGVAKSARRPGLLLFCGGLTATAAAYFVLRYFADHAGLFATINLGQHRHALDIAFASGALAMLIAGALGPPRSPAATTLSLAWASFIALDIAFGALFEALDARPLWTSFPGYTDSVLPTADRLFALHPIWRNLTENGYLVQTCHRVLSIGLWAAAAVAVVTAMLRGLQTWPALLLFGLLTLEGALGIASLQPGQPVVLSILHQVCAVAVLAAALAPRSTRGIDRTATAAGKFFPRPR